MNSVRVFWVFGNMDRNFYTLEKVLRSSPSGWSNHVQLGYHSLSKQKFSQSTKFYGFLDHDEYLSQLRMADILIGHAGVGFISDALSVNKKPFIFPRRKSLNEHINDHQYDFLKRYRNDGIFHSFSSPDSMKDIYSQISDHSSEKPTRKYITDLAPLVRKLHSDITKILKEGP